MNFCKQLIINLIAILVFFCACKNQQSQHLKEKDNFKSNNKNKVQKNKTEHEIPAKVYEIRAYVRQNGRAKQGYVGGKVFKNLERLLPIFNQNKSRIKYQEWDVNPKRKKQNRGKERLVTGSDKKDYFTKDHYKTFLKLQPND